MPRSPLPNDKIIKIEPFAKLSGPKSDDGDAKSSRNENMIDFAPQLLNVNDFNEEVEKLSNKESSIAHPLSDNDSLHDKADDAES